MRNKLLAILIGIIVTFCSCNDDIIENSFEDPAFIDRNKQCVIDSSLGFTVKIQDSIMYFPEAGDLLKALNVLHDMTSEARRNWEESIGFVSAKTLTENLIAEIKTLDNEDEYHELLKSNKDLVIESPDDLYGFKTRIYGFYPYITNRKGFFVSESYWGRVYNGKLYSCLFGDYEGYEKMASLSNDTDLSDSNVQMLQLDYNANNNLKSYNEELQKSSTKITLRMNNYAVNDPTKRSTFIMEIVNSYAQESISDIVTIVEHYYNVYYDGDCCDPSASYYYYCAGLGGWQYFERDGNGWRIRVPYSGYFDTHNFYNNPVPDWDDDVYTQITYPIYWYNYRGKAELYCSMDAEYRTLWWWDPYEGTVIYYDDVFAEFQVGTDVYYRSTARPEDVLEDGVNNNHIEDDHWDSNIKICEYDLAAYRVTPPVVFKGCVSGTLYSRFSPVYYYNFSYNY